MTERDARSYRTRYHARWVLPIASPPVAHGTVDVEGERISWAGSQVNEKPDSKARVVELGDVLLMPGLVNAHTHLDLTVLRGVIDERPFFRWVRQLVAAREQLSAADSLDSARVGILEGLHTGITTYADTAPTDASFEAMREMGVRGIAYREVFGPDPSQCDASLAGLQEAVTSMRARETALVKVGVSPHAPYSVSDQLYTAVAEYAREHGLPLATHVAESEDESALVARGDGDFAAFLKGRGIAVARRARSPVALLERFRVLAPNALLIHCVRCDAADIQAIAAHGAAVATCPRSNFFLHDGARAPFRDLRAAGVRVGVGSDSMASNHNMDVIAEATAAIRPSGSDPMSPDQLAVWELATLGGARALGLERDIGTLESGKEADLAAFPFGPRAASLVTVAGRELVRDGRIVAEPQGVTSRLRAVGERLREWRARRTAG